MRAPSTTYATTPSTGFGLFATLLGAIFLAGGFLLNRFGGESLLGMVPLALAVVVVYLVRRATFPSLRRSLQRSTRRSREPLARS